MIVMYMLKAIVREWYDISKAAERDANGWPFDIFETSNGMDTARNGIINTSTVEVACLSYPAWRNILILETLISSDCGSKQPAGETP